MCELICLLVKVLQVLGSHVFMSLLSGPLKGSKWRVERMQVVVAALGLVAFGSHHGLLGQFLGVLSFLSEQFQIAFDH